MKKSILMVLVAAMVLSLALPSFALQRIPYLEEFTSPTCGPCAPAVAQFESVITTWPTESSAIQYHMDWPPPGSVFYNYPSSVRKGYYSVNSIPRGFVDGILTSYSNWVSVVGSRMSVDSPISLTISGTYDTASNADTANVKVSITCESTMPGSDHKIFVSIVEDDLVSGSRDCERVNRAMNENGWGESFTIGAGESKDYDCSISVYPSDWELKNLRVIAWVQASDKSVQNSNHVLLSTFTGFPTSVSPTSVGNIKATYR